MVFKVGREEIPKEKTHSCTKAPVVNFRKVRRPALHCLLGWLPHRFQGGAGEEAGAAPQEEGPRPPASAGIPLRYAQE